MKRHAKAIVAISVLLLTLTGGVLSAFARDTHVRQGQIDGSGTPNGFQALRGLDVDQSGGDLYALDLSGAGDFSGAVHRFDSAGAYLNTIDGSGTPEGTLSFGDPAGVAVDDASNTVYVTATFHNLVDAFDPSGALVGSFASGGQLDGSATPAGSLSSPCGVAVDPATGDLYVGDQGNNRVWIFDSTGAYQGRLADSALNGPCGVAVDSTGAVYVQNVNDGKVLKFRADGEFQSTVQQGGATAIALDPANDHLFVDRGNEVLELDAEGNQLLAFGQGELGESRGLAVAPTGALYVADGSTLHRYSETLAVANPETLAATEVGETSAILHGFVDPEGGPEAECHFEYGTYGTEGSFDQSIPCTPAGPFAAAEEVSAEVSGLDADTRYQFRLVATNANGDTIGAPQIFQSAVKPGLSEVYANTLSTEATLKATIDPGAEPTSYRFEYGTDTSYGTTVPIPDGEIAEPTSGTGDISQLENRITNVATTNGAFKVGQKIVAPGFPKGTRITAVEPGVLTLSATTPIGFFYEGAQIRVIYPVAQTARNLEPHTVYHFRVVAENGTGITVSPDRTFRTWGEQGPPAPDGCPNAAVRAQQGSADLPECRAYEQVSPVDKNSIDALGFLRLSDDGKAVAWLSLGAFADPQSPGGSTATPYVARRDEGAWTTTNMSPRMGISRPGVWGRFGGYGFSDDLSSVSIATNLQLDPEDNDFLFGIVPQEDIYRVDDKGIPDLRSRNVTGPLGNEPVSAHIRGNSADGSSDFFRTSEPLDPTAPPGVQSLYRNRNGEVELVSRGEDGTPLPQGAVLGAQSSDGIVAGSGVMGTLPDSMAVSSDGLSFVYAAGGRLYLRERGGNIRIISRSQRTGEVGTIAPDGCAFRGAAEDLGKILLGCADQLTDDAPPYEPAVSRGSYYLYDVAEQKLTYIGVNTEFTPLWGQGVMKLSPNGEFIYFSNTEFEPGTDKGPQRLYAWGPSGTREIGPLRRKELNLKGSDAMPSYTTSGVNADGTRFVFQSAGNITGDEPSELPQIYLYDYTKDDTVCLSCVAGNGDRLGARLAVKSLSDVAQPRVIDDSGVRVVFTAESDLLPEDGNEVADAYEWVAVGKGDCREMSRTFSPESGGCLYLLSGGTGGAPTQVLGISRDGVDVYIQTRGSLAVGDSDNGLVDIYDVRSGGGSLVPLAAASCVEDACQGASAGPPAQPVIGKPIPGRNAKPKRRGRKACGKPRHGTRAKARCVKKHKQRVRSRSGYQAEGA